MANGSFAVSSSNKYVSAVVNWSSTPNTAGNYSDVYAELRASRTNSGYTTYGAGTGNWNINGAEVPFNITSSQKITYNSNTLLASASVRVYHDNDGTKSCYIAVGASIPGASLSLGPSGETPALDNIPRAASVISATDFTDEENTTINFSNPGGFRINARLEFGGSIIQRDNISNTGSYTFNFTDEERDLLRSKCATTNSMIVRHVIGTCIGGTTETHWAWHDKTMTIVNATPTINPTIKDTGGYSVPLTGNDQKIIKYFNYMNYDIGAVALKGASIVSQKITCGNVSYETATGGFNNVESGTFTIWVKDSRGNTNTKTVSLTLIEYVKISSSLDAHINLDSDNSTTINVIAFGNYFNGSFGAVNNTITLQYRYAVNDGEYSEWLDLTDITFETNSYQSAFTITSSDYKDVFKIQCRAIDKIGSKESIEKIVKVTPVFDWGEDDFNFNVPVFDNFGTRLSNGTATWETPEIDPDTTLEHMIITSKNTPWGDGHYFYIETIFDSEKGANKNRIQKACAQNANGFEYYRSYVDGVWSGWVSWKQDYGIATYDDGAIDPNTTLQPLILTWHANCPTSDDFWYIQTFFYGSKSTTGNRIQVAYAYGSAYSHPVLRTRKYYNGSWGGWVQFVTGNGISSFTNSGPGSYLHVNTSTGAYGIDWWASDKRMKKNIKKTSKNGIEFVKKLNHVSFDWKDIDGGSNVGLLAQELKEIDEKLVLEIPQPEGSEFETRLQINTSMLVPYLSKALQEVIEIVEEQQKEINKLKKSK